MFDFLREIQITWLTIKNDYNTTLIPITIYFLFAASQAPHFSLLPVLITSIGFATAYIVPFCLSNQLHGIEEDKVEKPNRPLAAGLITPSGAFNRYLIWNAILLGISIKLGVSKWSILWIAVTIFHNFLDGDKHFLSKNLISMTLGTAAQFGAAWHSYHPTMSVRKQSWMWMVAIWIGILANVQDFRDIQGDQRSHRRTLPLVMGTNRARILMSIISLIAGAIMYIVLRILNSGSLATMFRLGIFCWHVLLAGRLVCARTHRADEITYKYHLSFMYCAVVLSSFIFLNDSE
jgi:4-hydroxybenzoate polyprenyltransferase